MALAVLVTAAFVSCLSSGGASAQPPSERPAFREDWLADYAYLKAELERGYSHLAWLGSPSPSPSRHSPVSGSSPTA